METNYITTNKKEEAIKLINKVRLSNKNNWYQINLNYKDEVYNIKAYDTWVQIFTDNTYYSNCMDESVTKFKEHLSKVLK